MIENKYQKKPTGNMEKTNNKLKKEKKTTHLMKFY